MKYEVALARYERMTTLSDSGVAMAAIGQMEDPPLTKQRVKQILAAPPKRNGRPRKEDAQAEPAPHHERQLERQLDIDRAWVDELARTPKENP